MSIHYYPFINKMMTALNIRDSISGTQASSKSFIKPFITVAREPGSGGAPIAKAVAEKLGFEFVDEQLIEEIAKSTKLQKSIIKKIDEKNRKPVNDLVHSLINEDYVEESVYLRELVKTILTYANQGRVVILGRGANFITPFAKGLHVSVTAPYELRVQRAMDFEGHTRRKAKAVIKKYEAQREEFVRQYLKQDPKKNNAYDLTLNTTYYRVDEARDVILEAFYKKFSRSVRYGAVFK